MNDFIGTTGGYLSIAEVRSISKASDGTALLDLTDGSSCYSRDRYEDVVMSLGPVVPNTTGAVGIRISVVDDEDVLADGMYPACIWREPIVAWRVTPTGAVAILAEDTEITHILGADGTLISMDGSYYEDLEDAVASERKSQRPRRP